MSNNENYKEHRLKYRPPLSYIDMGNVIYNGRYPDIYNYARDEYMRDIGYSYLHLNTSNHNHLAVVEVNIKYRYPIHYDEETIIVTKVKKIGSKSIIFDQKIYKNNMEILCNEAKYTLVCIGFGFTSEKIPQELREAIKNGPKNR